MPVARKRLGAASVPVPMKKTGAAAELLLSRVKLRPGTPRFSGSEAELSRKFVGGGFRGVGKSDCEVDNSSTAALLLEPCGLVNPFTSG